MNITKACFKCETEKSLNEFHKDKRSKSGYCSYCKLCKNKYNKTYSIARRKNDPEFKLAENLRTRLGQAIKGKSKSQTTQQLIGVDFEMFTKWIDFQLEEGMAKENYGTIWQLDHVLPLASFNLLDEEELHKAMIWINLRPLSPVKNRQKSNKVDRWLYVMQEVKAAYFIKHLNEM